MSAETRSYFIQKFQDQHTIVDAIALADDNALMSFGFTIFAGAGNEANRRNAVDMNMNLISFTFDAGTNGLDGIVNINTKINNSEDTANQLVIPTATTGRIRVVYDSPIPLAIGDTFQWIIDSALAGAGGENVLCKGIAATFTPS